MLLQNLYAETAAAGPETPPLDGDRQVSVAIVGGGYTGLSTALHLAETGADVALVEAHEIGWGCSGRNGGQVNPGLKPYPDEVERQFGPDLGRRMVAISYAAPDRVFGLIRQHDIDCDARQDGTLRAAISEPTRQGVAHLAEQCVARSMPVEHLDADAISTRTGTGRYGSALLDRRGGSVNPLGYARGLARASKAAGASLYGGTKATRVTAIGRKWKIETSTGTLTADHLVICQNGYTDDLWPRLRQTIIPVYSAIAATEPLPAPVRASIMPSGSVLYEMGLDVVYYRIDAGGRLLMGGRGPQRDAAGPQDYAHLVAYAGRLWPQLKDVAWTHGWFGQVAITADHYPHLHEPAPNAHLALGYNGRGVAMATTMGALLAKRILGAAERDIDLPITKDLKPFWFHDFWKVGVAARMAYGRARDRLGV